MRQQRWNIAAAVEHWAAPLRPNACRKVRQPRAVTISPLTWGVSSQAHSFAPAAGVSPAKRGEAQRSRERSDLDAQRPATLSRASAPLRALGCLCGLCGAHSFCLYASPFAFGSEA